MIDLESDFYTNLNNNYNPLFIKEISDFLFSQEEEEVEEINKILENNNFIKSQEKICVEENNGLNYSNKEKSTNFIRKKTSDSSLCIGDKSSTQKEKLIFNISKIPKRGRHYNNLLYIKKAQHKKYNKDNIINKCKRTLIKNSFSYINSLLSQSNKIPKIKLKKINNSNVLKYNKQSNKNFLKMTLKELFSKEISKKYKVKRGDKYSSNENIIKELLENGDKKIQDALNKTLYDIFLIYIGECNKDDYCEEFITMKDDIEKFKKNYENDQYITLYEQKVNNFKNMLPKISEKKEREKNYLPKDIDE